MLQVQFSYFCIPVLQVHILSNPAISLLSFTSLASEPVLVSFPSCEARRPAEKQPPAWLSLALEFHLALSMPQELLYESTSVKTWKMASFCQSPSFSSCGTSLGKLWDLQCSSAQATKSTFRQMPLERLWFWSAKETRNGGLMVHALHRSYLCLLLLSVL